MVKNNEKTLIFCPYGYSDADIASIKQLIDNKYVKVLNSSECGFYACEQHVFNDNYEAYITAEPEFMNYAMFYSPSKEFFNIYFYTRSKDELSSKIIRLDKIAPYRVSQNLRKMYISGKFGYKGKTK